MRRLRVELERIWHPGTSRIIETWAAALSPPPTRTYREWADEEFYLSPESSPGLQKWKTRPYQAGVLDALSDPTIREVDAIWCTQGGKTSLCLIVAGYHIDADPAPILIVEPTLPMAETFSKDRVAPMLRDTPALRAKVQGPRARDSGNTTLHRRFVGGHLTMVGANSPTSLAMRPIRVLAQDEFAAYQPTAEGDAGRLSEKRTSEFWNRVVFKITSPRWKGDPSDKAWQKSDQRLWFVPCPDCGGFQHLKWSQVHFSEKNDLGQYDPDEARYACEHCGCLWSDIQRWKASRAGQWRATSTSRGIAGFRLPAMAVTGRRLADIVEEWLEAQGNPELLQVFVNTVLADWWEGGGDVLDENLLRKAAYAWELPEGVEVPEPVYLLTIGVDFQKDRLEYEVVGWGNLLENWSIDFGVIEGDVKKDDGVFDRLERVLLQPWHRADGGRLYIRGACLDTGGHATQRVYEFCDPRQKRPLPDGTAQFVLGIKGASTPGKPVWPDGPSRGKGGKRRALGKNLWLIGTHASKDQVAALLALSVADEKRRGGAGYCHLPIERPPWWFEQLSSEHVISRYLKGRPYRAWQPRTKGRPTEAWDCRNYAYAAYVGIQRRPFLLNLKAEETRVRGVAERKPARTAAATPAPVSVGVIATQLGALRRGWRSTGVEA